MKAVVLEKDGKKFELPVLDVRLWEEEEEGFVVREGYVYETPYGRVVTEVVNGKEVVVHWGIKNV